MIGMRRGKACTLPVLERIKVGLRVNQAQFNGRVQQSDVLAGSRNGSATAARISICSTSRLPDTTREIRIWFGPLPCTSGFVGET